jgi:tetratricopeptide (TPR) repeat protein
VGKSVQPEVTRLLKRGLNHYGLGDLEAAIASWEQALELDPKNRAAVDYLESAREELAKSVAAPRVAKPRKKAPAVEVADKTPRTLDAILHASSGAGPSDPVAQALVLYKQGQLEEAYALLEDVSRREPSRLDVEGYLAMIRGKRARAWARTVGDQGRALRVAMSMDRIKKLDLRPDEGYLLGQIDGVTSIEQLLSMSRDRVRALEIVARLLTERIVE